MRRHCVWPPECARATTECAGMWNASRPARSLLASVWRLPALRLRAAAGLVLCVGLLVASAPPATTAQDSGHDTLHLFLPGQVVTLNPLLFATLDALQVSLLAYDTLLVLDPHNRWQPDLAVAVPTLANGGISRDGKTITFKLRHGVRWHDGQPFTSADVAFTFAKINDPKVNAVVRSGYDRIVRMTTPDKYTIVITLKEPFAPFVDIAGYEYPIVPKHLLEKSPDINTDPIGSHPIGTGPYRFTSWERGSRIEYVANNDYFAGAPKIKHVVLSEIPEQNTVALALRTHQLDFGTVGSSAFGQLRTVADLRTATEPANDFEAYALNTASPILQDVRVRRALSLAIDRASIAAKNTFGTGTVAYADLPPILWTAHVPANPYAFNPAAAGALLDAAGWKRMPSGIRERNGVALRLRGINYSGNATTANIDVQVQQMLHDVGIDFSVKYYSAALYYESKANGGPIAAGNFDLAAVGFGGGINAQNDRIYTCESRPPGGFNFAYYCSPAMDALQRDSVTAVAPRRRAADVVKIEELAVHDMPYVFLYYEPWRVVWTPALHRSPTNLRTGWYDIANWSF